LRLSIRSLIKPVGIVLFLGPIVFSGFNYSAYSAEKSKDVSSNTKAATKKETYLYRRFGAYYLCTVRSLGVEYEKALNISASAFADFISVKHGGYVDDAPGKQFNTRDLYFIGRNQMTYKALIFCPDSVPKKVKQQNEKWRKELSEKD
tara:strand:+ start:297 stop:740 length:444 start_codon:yes stop_codon:yes gene_type:complete